MSLYSFKSFHSSPLLGAMDSSVHSTSENQKEKLLAVSIHQELLGVPSCTGKAVSVPFRFVAPCPGISAYQRSLWVLYRHISRLKWTRDSDSSGLLGHPLYGPMASADTTIKVLHCSDVGEPKPGNPESAGFFANTLTFIYYIILRFSNFPKISTT